MLNEGALGSFRGFARNPLGIIALFIVLVYGIAGYVSTSSNISGWNQTILLIFLSAFPFTVLYSFHRLVSEHFFKLFSPEDIGQKEFAQMVKAYLPDAETQNSALITDQSASEMKEKPEINVIEEVIDKMSATDRTALLISAIWQSKENMSKRSQYKKVMRLDQSVDDILKIEENRNAIFDVLNNLESFATEIYRNKLDPREVRRRSNIPLSIYWPFAEKVIYKIRKETKDYSIYSNLERLAIDWRVTRKMMESAPTT